MIDEPDTHDEDLDDDSELDEELGEDELDAYYGRGPAFWAATAAVVLAVLAVLAIADWRVWGGPVTWRAVEGCTSSLQDSAEEEAFHPALNAAFAQEWRARAECGFAQDEGDLGLGGGIAASWWEDSEHLTAMKSDWDLANSFGFAFDPNSDEFFGEGTDVGEFAEPGLTDEELAELAEFEDLLTPEELAELEALEAGEVPTSGELEPLTEDELQSPTR